MVHRVTSLLVALLTLGAAADAAAAERMPASTEALILARAIAYDRNLAARAGGRVTVIVLQASTIGSQGHGKDVLDAFNALSTVQIAGMPLDAQPVTWTDAAALERAIDGFGADAIYVSDDLAPHVASISGVCRARSVLSLASDRAYLSALSLGVFPKGSEPRVIVNVPASKAEGAAFGAELLRLAEVIQ